MREEEIKKYKDKYIKILLRNNFTYSGRIISISEESLNLIDKYKNNVTISLEDISIIMEVQ